jgi:hypothetical protein
MTALRLIDVLPDFGAPPPPTSPPTPRPEVARPAAPPPAPVVDIEAIVRARVAAAEEALRLELAREHEAAMAAERESATAALEAQARSLGAEAGARISTRLDELERQVRDALSSTVTRILGGLLTEDLQRRALASFAEAISSALAADDALRIEVRGPASLAEPLMEALGARAAAIHFTEAEGLDLGASIDGGILETRMSEWAEILAGIVA